MVVQLSSLRVTAEMDAAPWTKAASAVSGASKTTADAVKQLGTALAQADAQSDRAAGGVTRLSSRLLDGYGHAAKFESTIRSIGRAVDKGMGLDRAEVLLDAAYRKFGLTANAATLLQRGFVSIAPVVEQLNQHYAKQAVVLERTTEAQQGFANLVRGVGDAARPAAREQQQYADGVAKVEAVLRARARAEEAETERLWREAAAVKALTDAERARYQQEAAQRGLNAQLGVRAPQLGSAQQSAVVFEEQFRAAEAALSNLGRGVTEAARAQQQLEQQHRAMAASLDPVVAKTQALGRAEESLNAFVRAGIIDDREKQRLMALEIQRQDALINGTNRATNAYRQQLEAEKAARRERNIAQQQMLQLQFTINDVVASAMSGQKPLTILFQQGPQLTQAFAGPDGRGGLSGAFRALVTPTTLWYASLAAVAALMVTVIARAGALESQAKRVGATIQSIGGQSGLSASDVVGASRDQARLVGFGRGDTEEAAQALAAARQIQGQAFRETLALAREYALVTGQELPAATGKLIDSFTSGAAGLKRLDEQYNLFTAEQIRTIESLERQGRVQDLVRMGIDAMSARFKNGDAVLSDSRKLWDDLTKSVDGFLTLLAESPPAKAALEYLRLQARIMREVVDLSKGGSRQDPAAQQAAAMAAMAKAQADFDRVGTRGRQPGQSLLSYNLEVKQFAEVLEKARTAYHATFNQNVVDDQIAFGNALARTGQNLQDLDKKVDEYVKAWSPLREEARRISDEMQVLDDALSRATDPARIEQLTSALRKAGVAAYELSSSSQNPQNQATQDAIDAEEVAQADRRARALVQARQQAEQRYLDQTRNNPEIRSAEAMQRFVDTELRKTFASIGTAARDLFEDLDAGNQHLLDQANAYAKGLAEAYRTAARIAGEEAARTQAGVDAAAVERAKLQEQALQGLQVLRAGNLDIERQVEAQERLTAAEKDGVGALKDAERANQLAQFAFDARARAIASKNPAMIAAVEAEVEKHDALLKRLQDEKTAQEAIQVNRQYDSREALRYDISRLEDLAKTGKLTGTALQNALEDAYIRAGRASTSFIDGAIAGLLEFGRQGRQVGDQVAGAMSQAFGTATDLIARMMLGMKVNAKQALQETLLSFARIGVQSQITGPVAGLLGGLLNGGRGSGFMTGGQTMMLGGQPTTIGGGGLFGGGGLGGGGLFGDIGSFMNRPLFGGANPLLGSAYGGGLFSGSELYGPFLDGAGGLASGPMFGGGTTVGGILGGLGNIATGAMGAFGRGRSTAQRVGGGLQMVGGVMSMIPGPVGWVGMGLTLIGSILGMFNKKIKTPQEVSNITFNPDGSIGNAMAFERGRDLNSTQPASDAFGKSYQSLLDSYGLSMAPGSIGGWMLNSVGKRTGNQWIVGLGSYGSYTALPGVDPMGKARDAASSISGIANPEDAANILAGLIVRANARAGNIQGLSATQRTALSTFDLKSIEDIKNALDFSKTYDDIVRGNENITDAERAVRDLNDQFRALTAGAKQYGLDTNVLEQRRRESIDKLATDMNEDYRRRLLGQAPEGELRLQVEDTRKARDDAFKQASYLSSVSGVPINFQQIGQYYQGEFNKLGTAANDNIRRGRLGATAGGQLTLALEDLNKERTSARAQAEIINTVSQVLVDINALEASFAERRKALIDQAIGTAYEDLVRGAENVTDAEKAVRALNDQFKELKELAAAAGLSVDILQTRQRESIDKLATDMNADYRRRGLGMTIEGQKQLALEDMEKERTAAIANARYLNTVSTTLVDINQIEAYYAAQRVKIIEEANKAAEQSLAGLKDVYNSLMYGSLSGVSPEAMASGAKATYMATLAQAQSGNQDAIQRLSRDATDYVQSVTGAYGHGAEFGDIRQQVLSDLASIIGQTPGSTSTSQQLSAAAELLTAQARRIDELTGIVARLTDQMALFLAQQRRAA